MNACVDNETLSDISSRLYHQNDNDTKLAHLNEFVFNIISSSTAGLRFPGSLNCGLRKLAVNLLPFPRLKFLSISDAPLMNDLAKKYTKISIESLVTELFHSHQFLLQNPIQNGKYLSASCVFRGSLDGSYREWGMANGLRKTMREIGQNEQCLSTIPKFMHATLVKQASPKHPLTATLFANHTSIKQIFVRNLSRFKKLYERKAYLHYYTNTGQMTADFEDAMAETNDLLSEYADKDSSHSIVDEKELYDQIMDNLDQTHNTLRFEELRARHAAKEKSKRRSPKGKRKRKAQKMKMNKKKKKVEQNEKEYVDTGPRYYEPWRDPKRKVIHGGKVQQKPKPKPKKKKIKQRTPTPEPESESEAKSDAESTVSSISDDYFEEDSSDLDEDKQSSSTHASSSSASDRACPFSLSSHLFAF